MWARACQRGAVMGVVAAVHIAAYFLVTLPARPQPHLHPRQVRTRRADSKVLQVQLFTPPRQLARQPPLPRTSPDTPVPTRRLQLRTARVATRAKALRIDLVPAPGTSVGPPTRAYVAGAGLLQRLQDPHAPPPAPKLPGGHHYLAEDLAFVPIAQQSLAGKVHAVAGLLFGRFDPVCKNTAYELAKPRSQQIADGFTQEDLQHRLREHGCR